ncbi:hypothetical protein SLA2020_080610 [Shorea laevis]
MLVQGFRWEVGDGSRVGFWRQLWVGDKPLRDSFPRLFQLAMNKEGMVQENGKWEGESWRWDIKWRRARMGREQEEEKRLWEVMGKVQLRKDVVDSWKWRHEATGKYIVKKAYEVLSFDVCLLEDKLCKLVWNRWVPSKVSFFGWRLCLDRLPTRWNLQKRGITLQGDERMCGLCKVGEEDADHLFCKCREAWLVWVKVFQWWGMEVVMPATVKGMADIVLFCFGRMGGKEMGAFIYLIVTWYIWYWRNTLLFRDNGDMRHQLLEMIQVKSYFWIRNKVAGCAFQLAQWQGNPVECAKELMNFKKSKKMFNQQQQQFLSSN